MKEMIENWHLRLFNKSILKRAKLRAILNFLPPTTDKVCLDIGGDNGIISYFLRQKGGIWHSADLNDLTVSSIKSLVKTNVYRIAGDTLPFPDNYLDIIVIIDFLEHIKNDNSFIDELYRVIKNSGILIINVPHIKKFSLIRIIKNILKLTDEKHGHLRPGYTKNGIRSLLGGKFNIVQERTYSRFFTELLDTIINFAYSNPDEDNKISNKGLLITDRELKDNTKKFKIYSLVYPFMWLFSKLDILVFFTKGHKLIVKSLKT